MHAKTPVSAALVAWGNAWLAGHVGLDEAVDQVERLSGPAVTRPHATPGLPPDPFGAPSGPSPASLRACLAELRVAGLTEFRLALPVPGDPLGLSGPPPFNAAALDAGQAAIAVLGSEKLATARQGGNVGLVPEPDHRGSSYQGTAFTLHEAGPARGDLPSLAEAEQQLAVVMRTATQVFDGVDGPVSARPEQLTAADLAPGYPPRAHRVHALAARLAAVLELAAERGLSVAQFAARDVALRELDRAVRRALVAAHHAILEPNFG